MQRPKTTLVQKARLSYGRGASEPTLLAISEFKKILSMPRFSKIGPSETEWRAVENQEKKRDFSMEWGTLPPSFHAKVSKTLLFGSWQTNLAETLYTY